MNKDQDGKKTILLVEDEAIIAISQKLSLEQLGYDVVVAHTGERAIELFNNGDAGDSFTLILMDIDLGPGIDGTETARIILQQRDIPVVFLSSHTEPEMVEKTEKITSYGYVVKNSSITVLDASIKMAFKLSRAVTALAESRKRYRQLFEHSNSAVALHEMIYDESGRPVDYRYIDVNPAFERIIGLKADEVLNRRVREVLPNIEQYWLDTYGTVAQTGVPTVFENYLGELDRFLAVSAFQTEKDQFAAVIADVTDRKRMENRLKENETRYHNLVEQIPAGVYTLWRRANGEQQFEYVSDRWCSMQGLCRKDVMQNAELVSDQVHPDDRESFIKRQEEAARNATRFSWEGRFLAAGKGLRWFRIDATPVAHGNGDIRWFGVTQDATQERNLEETLHRREDQFQTLAENARDIVARFDRNLRHLYVNNALQDLTGFSPESVLGKTSMDVGMPEELAKLLNSKLEQVFRSGQETELLFDFPGPVGRKYFQTRIVAESTVGDAVETAMAVTRDITAQKAVESALIDQKRSLETILETATDGFLVVEPDGTISRVNESFCRMCGSTRDEIVGMPISNIDVVNSPQETAERIQRIIQNGSETFETTLIRKDETHLDVEVSTSRLDQADGVRLVSFCRDISERKRAEERTKRQLSQAETLLKEVHHRMKNNVASIDSLLSLQAASTRSDEAAAVLRQAGSRVQSIRSLYESLLIDEGYQEVSVRHYIERLADALASVFSGHTHVTVEKNVADFALSAKKAVLMGIVVNELLTNVFKHAFVGRDTGHVLIEVLKTERRVTLTVVDDGVGFGPEGVSSRSSGFGLEIVRMLAEQIEGTYTVESLNGTKSVLEFEIG